MKITLTQLFAAIFLCALAGLEGTTAQERASSDRHAAHAHYEKTVKKKEPAERLQWLQEGVLRYPFSAELHYALGREYHQRAILDSALVHFEAVLALDAALARKTDLTTFLPQAYTALATQNLKLGRTADALACAQRALRFHDKNAPALNVVALASYQLKRYEQALVYGKQLLTLQPSAQSYNNLAATYEASGDLPSALQNYQQAVALDAALAEAQSNLQRVKSRLAFEKAETTRVIPVQERLDKEEKTVHAAPTKPKSTAGKSKPSAKPVRALGKTVAPKFPLAKFEICAPRARAPILRRTRLAPLPTAALSRHGNSTTGSSLWAAMAWAITIGALAGFVLKTRRHSRWQLLIKWFVRYLPVRSIRGEAFVLPSENKSTEVPSQKNAAMLPRVGEQGQPAVEILAVPVSPLAHEVQKPLLSPEKGRLAPPAHAATSHSTQPQVGLQTELLFAEMIAAAPVAFESTGLLNAKDARCATNGASGSNGQELSNPNGAHEAEHAGSEPHFAATDNTATPPVHDEPAALLARTPNAEMGTANSGSERPLVPAALAAPQTASTTLTQTLEGTALGVQRIGRYVIERELAVGTTGKIHKAWDPKLDRVVVLKTVQYGISTSPTEIVALKDRIYREARAIAKLSHPNIVIVYDVDDQPEFSYLVMEYLEGRDLKQVLEKEHRLECRRALEIVVQVCSAMEYAHRAGVFHRDVKPSNIMLLGKDEVKVMDFGIAKISNYLSLTQTGRVLGTPSYMAPEQIEGHATDGRADLFSLGIVLYELLAGKRPFVADSLAALAYKIVHKTHIPPSLVNVELPLELDEVLNRLLAKQPAERYQTAAELREALQEIMQQAE